MITGTAPIIDAIPPELRVLPQWVAWRYTERDGKATKIPINPTSGEWAKCNDSKTWGTFDQALAAVEQFECSGIGFAFSAGDEFFGVDLDACRDMVTGQLVPWAAEIVGAFNSYTEVSPSGYGVKLTARGKLPKKSHHVKKLKDVPTFGDKAPEIEVFDRKRFWTFTGERLPGAQLCCEPRQEQLDALMARLWPPKASSNGKAHNNGKAHANGQAGGDWLEKLLAECAAAAEGERSERDFNLCAAAIRHGCTADEIWARVFHVGKFCERGREYFNRTWEQAAEEVAKDPPKRRRRRRKPPFVDDPNDKRPVVEVTVEEHEVNDEAVAALAADKTLFERAVLVHVVRNADSFSGIHRPAGAPRILLVVAANLRERLARSVRFVKKHETRDGVTFERVHPPEFSPGAILARGTWPGIRRLNGVITNPVLRPNGHLIEQPGYDPETGLLYEPSGIDIQVPTQPTAQQITTAVEALLEVFADFPFAKFEHKATAIAYLLSPLARYAHSGPVPFFLSDGNTPGSGKTKLLIAGARISIGRDLAVMSNPESDAEARKLITAIAIEGDPIVLVDNLGPTGFGCPSIDAALTGTTWKNRKLTTNETSEMPLLTVWCGSGNNVALKGDTARRVAHIRLESLLENPEERTGFRHPDLLGWVTAERPRLLSAALTILRGYCAAGKPSQGLLPWGSFEGWSDLVRSAVVWAGLADPGLAREELRLHSNSEMAGLQSLLERWPEVDPEGTGVTAAAALEELDKEKDQYKELRAAILELCPAAHGKLPGVRSLGNKLRAMRGRVISGKYLDKTELHGIAKWFVTSVTKNPS
jgi:hypothetical protein